MGDHRESPLVLIRDEGITGRKMVRTHTQSSSQRSANIKHKLEDGPLVA